MNIPGSIGSSLTGGNGGGRAIKDTLLETRLFRSRATFGLVVIVLGTVLLLARYTWLQVVAHEEFSARSNSNRVRVIPVAPNRGLIYDRRGRPLAENLLAYRLELVPEKAGDLEDTLNRLATIVELPEDARQKFNRDRQRFREFDAVTLKFNLSEE
jgi:penicillin-binding protein 2